MKAHLQIPGSGQHPAVQCGQTRLAAFVHELRLPQLPPTLRTHAARVATDLVGVVAAGLREPEVSRLADRMCVQSAGRCTVIGRSSVASPDTAALLHGIAGTSLELDEGNRFSRGHPGIHVLPVALAVAQQLGACGDELLEAFVAGYEVAARIGAASTIRPVMHPHGTWGTVGAAVAVRKLRGGSAEDMERTIAIASTLGLATSVNTMRDGGTVRNAFAGVSARMALLANDLADAGFTGEADGLSSVFDGVVCSGFDWSLMLNGLGERWEIARNYFKLHACCRFAHATLDALAVAVQPLTAPLDPHAVHHVDVYTYGLAARLAGSAPHNPLAAKYSLPFAVATALVNRSTGVESFGQQAVDDLRVRALARRVSVHEDAGMTRQLPELRQAKVVLRLSDGQEFIGSVHTNRGDAEEPITDEELHWKFMELGRGTWTDAQSATMHRRLLSLHECADVSDLFLLE